MAAWPSPGEDGQGGRLIATQVTSGLVLSPLPDLVTEVEMTLTAESESRTRVHLEYRTLTAWATTLRRSVLSYSQTLG